jgi:hypothetical protein
MPIRLPVMGPACRDLQHFVRAGVRMQHAVMFRTARAGETNE